MPGSFSSENKFHIKKKPKSAVSVAGVGAARNGICHFDSVFKPFLIINGGLELDLNIYRQLN